MRLLLSCYLPPKVLLWLAPHSPRTRVIVYLVRSYRRLYLASSRLLSLFASLRDRSSNMADTENTGNATRSMSKDEGRLRELGYKQELKRDWSMMHNFGVSFSIISVITGITTLFEYGLTTGGPGVMSAGW